MNLRELGPLNLLTALIWGESRGESFDGKCAVGFVVKNRTKDHRWPDTYEGVILQPKQFSCLNFNDPNYHEVLHAVLPSRNGNWQNIIWRECRISAYIVMNNWRVDPTKEANHYHGTQMEKFPHWAYKANETVRIGNHVFYKF